MHCQAVGDSDLKQAYPFEKPASHPVYILKTHVYRSQLDVIKELEHCKGSTRLCLWIILFLFVFFTNSEIIVYAPEQSAKPLTLLYWSHQMGLLKNDV